MTPTSTATGPGQRSKSRGSHAARDPRALPACDPLSRFRLRSAAEESPAAARATRLAVARASQGDREALRYLYVRYADNVYSYVASILRDHPRPRMSPSRSSPSCPTASVATRTAAPRS
jgi:hypothetical protein